VVAPPRTPHPAISWTSATLPVSTKSLTNLLRRLRRLTCLTRR
jgi:hypothetical protein